ncbi:hypothetical protein B0H17DRAFT_1202185 [Mycena rosella]|uniref:Uncharacterized protein n=1 Tax=Mycena rosella TaxID=1033263 RepID=A0AAD7GDM5_MYCRO|nr:hypothetical protein B0H17DRAFT_1202185 [Mycena rosella]
MDLDTLVTFGTPLTLGSLQSLDVHATALEPFRALLDRSSCQLQQLTVGLDLYEKTKYDDLLSIFRLVPTVTDLKLITHGGLAEPRHTVGSLSPADVLPSLEHLAIDTIRMRDGYEALLSVLRTRRNPNSGHAVLETFSLTLLPHRDPEGLLSSDPFPEPVMAQFRDLAVGGLQIKIRLQAEYGYVHLLANLGPPTELF